MKLSYNPKVVSAFFEQHGLGHIKKPVYEYRFCPKRRWRFDLAWPGWLVAVEVQGGIWSAGRHARGSGIKGDMEKYNEAACMGWRILFVEPQNLMTQKTIQMLIRCLPPS